MKSHVLAATVIGFLLTACSNLPDTRMEWMKRRFIDVDTVLTGDAASILPNLYGTYKVVGKSSKVNQNLAEIKLVRSPKGNPVLRYFDNKGKEFESWSTPKECYGTRLPSGEFQKLECGGMGDRKGYGQFTLSRETGDSLESIYPKNISITVRSYHYDQYEGWGKPILDIVLEKIE